MRRNAWWAAALSSTLACATAPARAPGGRRTRTLGCPVRLDGAPVPVSDDYPSLGEHTQGALDVGGTAPAMEGHDAALGSDVGEALLDGLFPTA